MARIKNYIRKLAVKAWDAVKDKSFNATLALASKKLSESMQENHDKEPEQSVEGTDIPIVKEDMTDEEDEQFVNDIMGAIKMDFSTPESAKESFEHFVSVAGEVAKFSELQKTKRTQILADAEIAIKKVEAMRDVLKDYLAKSFDERSAMFLKQFEVVDNALVTGDNVMLSAGLASINELAASNPFKALTSITDIQKMLTDNTEIDI